jgi:predicted PolB exonuclease-like 3'-5' exonuclease
MSSFNNILFLDIETVPQFDCYGSLPDEWKLLWDSKAAYLVRNREGETSESVYNRAGIYAEFGKIVCISCGYISGSGAEKKLVLKSFYGDDEKKLLTEFCNVLVAWSRDNQENKLLCAHNGKEFDFPFLCRRMIINRIPVPPILNTQGKKPWEVKHLDTMEMWRFGDAKNYTSLNLLACVLGIPSPKDDIHGGMVWELFWTPQAPEEKEQAIQRIVTYCQKDVLTVAQVYLRLSGEELLSPESIEVKV